MATKHVQYETHGTCSKLTDSLQISVASARKCYVSDNPILNINIYFAREQAFALSGLRRKNYLKPVSHAGLNFVAVEECIDINCAARRLKADIVIVGDTPLSINITHPLVGH